MNDQNQELDDLEADNAADIKGGVQVKHNGRTIASADANLQDGVTASAGDVNAAANADLSGAGVSVGDHDVNVDAG